MDCRHRGALSESNTMIHGRNRLRSGAALQPRFYGLIRQMPGVKYLVDLVAISMYKSAFWSIFEAENEDCHICYSVCCHCNISLRLGRDVGFNDSNQQRLDVDDGIFSVQSRASLLGCASSFLSPQASSERITGGSVLQPSKTVALTQPTGSLAGLIHKNNPLACWLSRWT